MKRETQRGPERFLDAPGSSGPAIAPADVPGIRYKWTDARGNLRDGYVDPDRAWPEDILHVVAVCEMANCDAEKLERLVEMVKGLEGNRYADWWLARARNVWRRRNGKREKPEAARPLWPGEKPKKEDVEEGAETAPPEPVQEYSFAELLAMCKERIATKTIGEE